LPPQKSDFKAKCIEFYFGWGFAPLDLLAGFKGPTNRKEGGRKGKRGRGRKGMG